MRRIVIGFECLPVVEYTFENTNCPLDSRAVIILRIGTFNVERRGSMFDGVHTLHSFIKRAALRRVQSQHPSQHILKLDC